MKWTEEKKANIFDVIINRICEGESLRAILFDADRNKYPAPSTFFEWIAEDKTLADKYARACEVRAQLMEGEIIAIADSSNADVVGVDKFGKPIVDGDAIQRSRLKIDARKWLMAKMMPKKYGDKLDVDAKMSGNIVIQMPGEAEGLGE